MDEVAAAWGSFRAEPGRLRRNERFLPSLTLSLGMPHLAIAGLSETWLAGECGHRHRVALADLAGASPRAPVDGAGRGAVPTFLALRIHQNVEAVREGLTARLETQAHALSDRTHGSVHRLFSLGGTWLATVGMISRMAAPGSADAGRETGDPDPAPSARSACIPLEVSELAEEDQRVRRAGRPPGTDGMRAAVELPVHPLADFDAAGLMCFTRLLDAARRAEAACGRRASPTARWVFVLGTAHAGDALRGFFEAGDGRSFDATLVERTSDAMPVLVSRSRSRNDDGSGRGDA